MTYDQAIAGLAARAAHAVARAEGYFVTGSLPQRINTPGDMKLGDRGHGVEQGKTIYMAAADGWAALEREWTAILTGSSGVYTVAMTFEQVALRWTGGDDEVAWCNIVCQDLGLDPATTLASWVKGAVNESVN